MYIILQDKIAGFVYVLKDWSSRFGSWLQN